jgi:phosphoribosyl-AMP cyclohydrolase
LVPVIVQEARSKRVLMLGYCNGEAVRKTIEEKRLWMWSRSRRELWLKGRNSGNFLKVRKLLADCDSDALLAVVDYDGRICHEGRGSCFSKELVL